MARFFKICSPFVAVAALGLFTPCAFAQTFNVGPRNRIVSPIVDSDVVTLAGNVHPLARPEFDRGVRELLARLFPDTPLKPLAPEHPIWVQFARSMAPGCLARRSTKPRIPRTP